MSNRIEQSLQYYKKACEIIPGGSQMFNKRPCSYDCAPYPIFAEKAEGPYLYDVDGNRYIDYLLAYGAILLGYNYGAVQDAVTKQLHRATIHSVNDPIEIELAEELIKTIPGAEMVRYFLSGSEATSAAVRIARAYTRRSKIVNWGYHGWHDWTITSRHGHSRGTLDYLSMINCPEENWNHVPVGVAEYTIEFEYNNIESLKQIMESEGGDVACIITEPFHYAEPKNGFLQQAKEIAHRYGSLFILDEIKTGSRVAHGGAQEYYGVVPDISTFGKAISNGYPFSLVAGKKDIMQTCERLWFSGTNSGNAIGISAALATVRESKKLNAPKHIWDLGKQLMEGMGELLRKYGVDGQVGGLPPMPYLTFLTSSIERKKAMTFAFLSELINGGVFMPVEHALFITYSHTRDDIGRTLEVIERAFKRMGKMS